MNVWRVRKEPKLRDCSRQNSNNYGYAYLNIFLAFASVFLETGEGSNFCVTQEISNIWIARALKS